MKPTLLSNSQMRQLTALFLFFLVFGIMWQEDIKISLSANAGAVALNNAYDRPELFTRQLQLAQMTLIRKANQSVKQQSGWAQAGLAFLLENKLPEAEDAWQQSMLPAESLLQYAAHARELGYVQTALKICDLVIAVDPTFRDPWYLKADIWTSQGDHEAALAAFQHGLEGTEYGRYGQSDFSFRMGEIYALFLPESDLVTAQTMYTQAIRQNDFQSESDYIRTRFLHGEAYRIFGKLAAAMAEYRQVLSLNSNHYWANIRLGQLLWSETQELTEVETLLLRAIASNAQEKGAYKMLGAVYLDNGRFSAAQTMYETVLKLDPTDAQAIQAIEIINTNVP